MLLLLSWNLWIELQSNRMLWLVWASVPITNTSSHQALFLLRTMYSLEYLLKCPPRTLPLLSQHGYLLKEAQCWPASTDMSSSWRLDHLSPLIYRKRQYLLFEHWEANRELLTGLILVLYLRWWGEGKGREVGEWLTLEQSEHAWHLWNSGPL